MEVDQQLSVFIEKVSELCKAEYNRELEEITLALTDASARLAYGRLLGIMLKEPFSSRVLRASPSDSTGGSYNWLWDPDRVRDKSTHDTWQYRALGELVKHHRGIDTPSEDDIGEFIAYEGELESRIFMFLMKSAHKNLCEDRARRRSIQTVFGKTSKLDPARPNIPAATATVVSAVVATFGHYGVVLGPLAGGIALMITRIGLDAFCLWANEEVEEVRRLKKIRSLESVCARVSKIWTRISPIRTYNNKPHLAAKNDVVNEIATRYKSSSPGVGCFRSVLPKPHKAPLCKIFHSRLTILPLTDK
jgi:hypothetical protein